LAIWFNPNKFKPLLINKIKQLSGIEIALPEAISWTIIPKVGLAIKNIKIVSPAKFTSANIKQLLVQCQLLPLLKRQLLLSQLTLGQLQLGAIDCHNISGDLQVSNELLALTPLSAFCYQGQLQGSLSWRLATQNSSPVLTLAGTFSNINLNDLIAHLSHANALTKLFSGQATIELAKLSSQGNNLATIINNLTGSGKFTILNGMLNGVDINFYMATAAALLAHQALPLVQPTSATLFTKCTASFTIKDGVLYNNDLLLLTPKYRVSGQGRINFPTQTINYTLAIHSQMTPTANEVPPLILKITGQLNDFKVNIANDTGLAAQGKAALAATTEKIAKFAKYLPQRARDFISKFLPEQ
jgi:uncharacterized protein involved in outer membrane biogenesis